MVKTEAPAELQPIDQLAERIRSLIEVLGTTRDELKLALDENTRLTGEVEELRGQLQAADDRQTRERDEIRERISGMLEQIEEISL